MFDIMILVGVGWCFSLIHAFAWISRLRIFLCCDPVYIAIFQTWFVFDVLQLACRIRHTVQYTLFASQFCTWKWWLTVLLEIRALLFQWDSKTRNELLFFGERLYKFHVTSWFVNTYSNAFVFEGDNCCHCLAITMWYCRPGEARTSRFARE